MYSRRLNFAPRFGIAQNLPKYGLVIRTAPGVTIESAEAALDAITRRLDEQDPSLPLRDDEHCCRDA